MKFLLSGVVAILLCQATANVAYSAPYRYDRYSKDWDYPDYYRGYWSNYWDPYDYDWDYPDWRYRRDRHSYYDDYDDDDHGYYRPRYSNRGYRNYWW